MFSVEIRLLLLLGLLIPISAILPDYVICNSTQPGTLIIAEPFGVLDYPEGRGAYGNNLVCYWRIVSPLNQPLRYRFTHFDLEPPHYELYDYIRIYEDENKLSLGDFDAEFIDISVNLPNNGQWQVTSGSELIVAFKSDARVNMTGFTLEWTYYCNARLGGTCQKSADCRSLFLKNSECVNGVCRCASGYHLDKRNWSCLRIKIGSPCSNDQMCRQVVPGSRCIRGHCSCPSNRVEAFTDVSSTVCVIPFHPSAYPVCALCQSTDGVCYDSNNDGIPDKCGCTQCTMASKPVNSLSTGCDKFFAYVGQRCERDGSVTCLDKNAECLHDGGLNNRLTCTCKRGYTAVKDGNSQSVCAMKIVEEVDPECKTCMKNDGLCYDLDDDGLMDGCQCPRTRTSSCDSPLHACDTQHVRVNCNERSMTICVVNKEAIIGANGSVYVEGHRNHLSCHFNQKPTGDLSLTQAYGGNRVCDLQVVETENYISYESRIVLRRHYDFISSDDACIYAYCRYDKYTMTYTDIINIHTNKLAASEGRAFEPEITMTVTDKFQNRVEGTAVTQDSEIKLSIEIIDDQGVYTSLRAGICLVSDNLSLRHPDAQSAAFILKGCPHDIGIRPLPIFFPDVSSKKKIVTNFFPLPTFGSPIIFFHCCVKVCWNDADCAPKKCRIKVPKTLLGANGSVKAASKIESRRIKSLLTEYSGSDDSFVVTSGVFMRRKKSNLDDEFNRTTVLTEGRDRSKRDNVTDLGPVQEMSISKSTMLPLIAAGAFLLITVAVISILVKHYYCS